MIKGVHTMFYSSQAAELRAFLRDTLELPFTDVGDGWLIFDLPEADMGVHPAEENQPHARAGTHDISFYCDDVRETVAGLEAKGVEFMADVVDHGYGLVTYFKMPGNVTVQLYQPKYAKRSASKQSAIRRAPVARKAATRKSAKKTKRGVKKKLAKTKTRRRR